MQRKISSFSIGRNCACNCYSITFCVKRNLVQLFFFYICYSFLPQLNLYLSLEFAKGFY